MLILGAYLLDPIKLELSAAREPASLIGSLAAFAWPLVTLVILYLYREALGKFLVTISARATEIGIGSWATIKLPEVKEATNTPVDVIREIETDKWQESSTQWFKEFSDSPAPSEYALIDLGDGNQWITSRLFIFAVILQRMKALKCIVFARSLPSGGRHFIGCASPDNVRWSLATNQPWLESAFGFAYSQAFPAFGPAPVITSPITRVDGSIEPFVAQQIISTFIASLKDYTGTIIKPDPLNWVTLKSGTEHATWLNELEVQRLIGVYLWRDAIKARTDDSPDQKRLEVKAVVRKSAPYVAILKDDQYKSLVNRIALLSEIGQSIV
jgi:hypothetical protein